MAISKPELSTPATSPAVTCAPDQVMYQNYRSARTSMRMITPTGKRIAFAGHDFLTDDEEVIEYLDSEIKKGLRDVIKGKLLPASAKNPMEALRRKHIEEYLEQQKEITAGARIMGTTEGASTVAPMSSKSVAN